MNPAERVQFLRERFKARKPSSAVAVVKTQVQPKRAKWWECYGTGKISHGTVALGALEREHWRKEWISEPNESPAAHALPVRRKAKVSPLTVIGEKFKERIVWPKYQNLQNRKTGPKTVVS